MKLRKRITALALGILGCAGVLTTAAFAETEAPAGTGAVESSADVKVETKADEAGESEEAVNDTYLKAWNTIPPQEPKSLGAYLSVIVRNISLDRYRKKKAVKRIDDSLMTTLDEAAQMLPDGFDIEKHTEQRIFIEHINRFLKTLPQGKRVIFVRRYFFMDSIKDIAQRYNYTESSITVTLTRIRKKLVQSLKKEGMI